MKTMPILPVTTASDGTYQTVCVAIFDNCLDECSEQGSVKEGLFLGQDPRECTWTLIRNREATLTRAEMLVLMNVGQERRPGVLREEASLVNSSLPSLASSRITMLQTFHSLIEILTKPTISSPDHPSATSTEELSLYGHYW